MIKNNLASSFIGQHDRTVATYNCGSDDDISRLLLRASVSKVIEGWLVGQDLNVVH